CSCARTPVSSTISSFPLLTPEAATEDTLTAPYPPLTVYGAHKLGEGLGTGAPFLNEAALALEPDHGLVSEDEQNAAGASV
ncbi:NAD-dependent epimerase/dehydratase family protein, partial [Klebsiella pneumoniae]|nr:NAD-dependent epimerase/dehydratase family protein [Klebsiella pneumoniae]